MAAAGGIRVKRGYETEREHGQIAIRKYTPEAPMGILPDAGPTPSISTMPSLPLPIPQQTSPQTPSSKTIFDLLPPLPHVIINNIATGKTIWSK